MKTIREEYLNRLTDEFKTMSDAVIEQLEIIHKQIKGESSEELFVKIKANEQLINQCEVKIREEIVNSIVLQSPRATDLRRLIAYFDMIGNLERTGDLLYGISKRMSDLLKKDSIYELFKEDALKLFEMSNKMIQNAIFAFIQEDNDIANNVIRSDDFVDDLDIKIHKKLLSITDKEKYPDFFADSLNIERISYKLERIGDSATNIAEAVIFLTEGRDIKHIHKI